MSSRLAFMCFIFALLSCDGESTSSPPGPVLPRAHLHVDATKSVATIGPRFLSVAVDAAQVVGGPFWSASLKPGAEGDLVKPPYDFARPGLRTLAAELSPAYLRVGGSAADKVYIDLSASPVTTPPAPYKYVLTRAEWDGMVDFATALDFQLVFTVPAGQGPRDAALAWLPDNAAPLFAHAADQHAPVALWELGNELNGFPLIDKLTLTPNQFAHDYATFRTTLRAAIPDARVGGPSSAYWPMWGELNPMLAPFVHEAASSLDVITWHYYPQQSERCAVASLPASVESMLDPANLDEIAKWAADVESARDESVPNAEVWLGETGNAQCGGQPGVSDVFVSGFWWLDELGQMARRGQQAVIRQTLSGSDYGLLDDDTLEPRADYWTSILWRRTMGTRVLDVSLDTKYSGIRAYAHCSASGPSGSVAIAAINTGDDAIELSLDGIASGPIEVYVLSATTLTDRTVRLNGTTLALDQGKVPALAPLQQERAQLPPHTYGFFVIPGANASACAHN